MKKCFGIFFFPFIIISCASNHKIKVDVHQTIKLDNILRIGVAPVSFSPLVFLDQKLTDIDFFIKKTDALADEINQANLAQAEEYTRLLVQKIKEIPLDATYRNVLAKKNRGSSFLDVKSIPTVDILDSANQSTVADLETIFLENEIDVLLIFNLNMTVVDIASRGALASLVLNGDIFLVGKEMLVGKGSMQALPQLWNGDEIYSYVEMIKQPQLVEKLTAKIFSKIRYTTEPKNKDDSFGAEENFFNAQTDDEEDLFRELTDEELYFPDL
ncbi:MAG: hypothetical protein ACRC5H_05520 [Treponemataceae bacterium]